MHDTLRKRNKRFLAKLQGVEAHCGANIFRVASSSPPGGPLDTNSTLVLADVLSYTAQLLFQQTSFSPF
jgi:hypothetical protein